MTLHDTHECRERPRTVKQRTQTRNRAPLGSMEVFEFFVLGALPTWALQAPASHHQPPSLAQFETVPLCFSVSVCACVYGSLRAATSSHSSLQNCSGLWSSSTKRHTCLGDFHGRMAQQRCLRSLHQCKEHLTMAASERVASKSCTTRGNNNPCHWTASMRSSRF